jgi:hypothetical protein
MWLLCSACTQLYFVAFPFAIPPFIHSFLVKSCKSLFRGDLKKRLQTAPGADMYAAPCPLKEHSSENPRVSFSSVFRMKRWKLTCVRSFISTSFLRTLLHTQAHTHTHTHCVYIELVRTLQTEKYRRKGVLVLQNMDPKSTVSVSGESTKWTCCPPLSFVKFK